MTARLILTAFVLSFFLSATAMVPPRPAPSSNCACPLCRNGQPGHQCSCCMKKKSCSCQVSSGLPDRPPHREVKQESRFAKIAFGIPPELRLFSVGEFFSLPAPYRAVPTPPPKHRTS